MYQLDKRVVTNGGLITVGVFHIMAKLALKYLSAPPTSVPSERLFSIAGDVYDERRNKLSPEMLLFIKTNYKFVNNCIHRNNIFC